MERPLDIAFHNISSTPEAEAEIRSQVDKIQNRYTMVTGCRVSVEVPHRHQQHGNMCSVHVTFSVPGREIAVSHEPHHAKERRAHPDMVACIKDAFKMAEKRLETYKGHLNAPVSPPNDPVIAE